MSDVFTQSERALGIPGLAASLEQSLAGAPHPGCNLRAARVLEAAAEVDAERLRTAWQRDPVRFQRFLWIVCGVAPFLAVFLVRNAHWLGRLLDDDLAKARTPEDYRQTLERKRAENPSQDEASLLRRFRYFELARIVLRDCSPDIVPLERAGDPLREIAYLADAVLAQALRGARDRIEQRIGPPIWKDGSGAPLTVPFCVLGLGKLGGEELNFSSDVDLVYIYGPESGELTSGPSDQSPQEYFTQVAQEFGRSVGANSAEGMLYRIDLDLRPEGDRGLLVISNEALAEYYDGQAMIWERAAFMKARPVAGDLDFGWHVIREIAPMIYRSSMDLTGIAAIREMRERTEEQRARGSDGFDVKLGSGGIRDVELVAQSLQLLHGGRIPQVRDRSTQRALRYLAEAGVIPRESADTLSRTYLFLRRLENRIQMESERQTHRLPAANTARERIARAMDFDRDTALADFDAALAQVRGQIVGTMAELLQEAQSDKVLALFLRHAPRLFESPAMRAMIEDLALRFAREIDASADPERATNNLDRFLDRIGSHPFYYGLLMDRPELVPRLAALFGASRFLSTLFASHPQLIEPVFRDASVGVLSSRELRADLQELREEAGRSDDVNASEVRLRVLRHFQHRQLVNVGLLDLGDRIDIDIAQRALTEIAETCIEEALDFSYAEMARRSEPPQGEFLIVGMGKLASRELSYGSDLDVIFLYDAPADGSQALSAQEYYVRLAQRLIGALQTRTSEGVCYEVDSRLRPSGQQGSLVSSIESFERYHAKSSEVWERQALLRSRALTSDGALPARFEAVRQDILTRPLPDDLALEIRQIRQRFESEVGREGAGRRDLKTGRGGLLDIENVVQFLQLREGSKHSELLEARPTRDHLKRLEFHGILATQHAEILLGGWAFLQRLASRLRIVENRSISELREDRADLDSVARALGYAPAQHSGDARVRLLDDYRRHTEAIRGVYGQIIGGDSLPSDS